jgi:hypothetical protein
MDRTVSLSRLILGLTLAVVGVGIVLDRTGAIVWVNRHLWPVLLIGLGTARLLEPRTKGPRKGLLLLSLGFSLLLVSYGLVSFEDSWPILLIIVGLGVVLDSLIGWGRASAVTPSLERHFDSSPLVVLGIVVALLLTVNSGPFDLPLFRNRDGVRVVAVMGTSVHVDREAPFRGAQVAAVMGRSELDLRNTSLAAGDQVDIEVTAVMGQAVIRVPDGWTVDTKAIPIMGQVRDRRFPASINREGDTTAGGAPRLVLKGVVVMGGVLIES